MNVAKIRVRTTGTVKQFTYRTARVDNVFLKLERTFEMDALQNHLALAAGSAGIANHEVYEVVQSEGQPPVYIMFSDLTAIFALSLREGKW